MIDLVRQYYPIKGILKKPGQNKLDKMDQRTVTFHSTPIIKIIYDDQCVQNNPLEHIKENFLIKQFRHNPLCIFDDDQGSAGYIMKVMKRMQNENFEKQKDILSNMRYCVNLKYFEERKPYDQSYTPIIHTQYRKIQPHIAVQHATQYQRLHWLINNCLETIQAEIALIDEIQHHATFYNYNPSQLYSLFMDAQDKYTYKSELGYLKGFFKGFTEVLVQIRNKTFIANQTNLLSIYELMTNDVELFDGVCIHAIQTHTIADEICPKFILRQVTTSDKSQSRSDMTTDTEKTSKDQPIQQSPNDTMKKSDTSILDGLNFRSSFVMEKVEKKIIIRQLITELQGQLQTDQAVDKKALAISKFSDELKQLNIFVGGNEVINIFCMGVRLSLGLPFMTKNHVSILDLEPDSFLA